jgi:hypothetical protein
MRDYQPIYSELHGAKMLYNVQSEQIINPVYVYAIKSSSNPGETMNNNHGPGPAKKKG